MDTQMSEKTRQEVLAKKRGRYARAGKEHKGKILDEVIELFGYHRKAAIRALRPKAAVSAPYVPGRPKEYDPEKLLPPLKAIWLAALQPCGTRLKACLPDWLPAYEEDHRRLDADVRQALLAASRATLDRLLIPARIAHRRRAATRPGSLLRAEIPIRTEWLENAPGYLELDTVALCGGSLDDRHGWMLDAVDIHTGWSVLRGLPNRGEASVCGQMDDLRAGLPFPLRGIDSDNGGEFINHQLVRYCAGQEPPVAFTRSRPYKKNDQAHIEQKNYTHVRLWFGYERYDRPEVWPLINALCRGPLDRLFNWFLPTMKLERKERVGSKTVRHYGPTQTPLDRVMACAEVGPETKARLRADKAAQNPFALRREVDRQMREIEAVRRLVEP
ncbi:MAG: integrase [Opitutaceae bacterium]